MTGGPGELTGTAIAHHLGMTRAPSDQPTHSVQPMGETTMKLYIAGPMSGLPDYNYPAFHVAEAKLRSVGYETLNPARNPKPEPETWEGYMRLALAQVIEADGIAFLPGARESRGALLELHVASELGIPAKPVIDWLEAADV